LRNEDATACPNYQIKLSDFCCHIGSSFDPKRRTRDNSASEKEEANGAKRENFWGNKLYGRPNWINGRGLGWRKNPS
jgi:hypothetical protein